MVRLSLRSWDSIPYLEVVPQLSEENVRGNWHGSQGFSWRQKKSAAIAEQRAPREIMLISVVRFLIANYFGLFRSLLGRIILDTTPGIPRRIYERWLYAIVKDLSCAYYGWKGFYVWRSLLLDSGSDRHSMSFSSAKKKTISFLSFRTSGISRSRCLDVIVLYIWTKT